MKIVCAYCGALADKASGSVNRALAKGAPLFCSRTCSGLRRRLNRTFEEKRALKAAYDAKYRENNSAKLKQSKAAYYAANADRERERAYRAATMQRHVEYCRRPEYREWKAKYDQHYRARKEFGDFGEAAIILNNLCSEIAARSTFTERAILKGTLNKRTQRRREYERQTDRR